MSQPIQETKNIPKHVAIIMDGNRRWARERNLEDFEGHLKGYEVAKKIPNWFFSKGVEIISLYAFSQENWNRSQKEVNLLMNLLKMGIEEETKRALKEDIKVIISGDISELPGDLPDACKNVVTQTSKGKKGIINICMNYGGRNEIINAIGKIITNETKPEKINEEMIKRYLYTNELSDPDMIIRTSGEQRLSGFLLWQSAYSELMFLKKYWPEFEESDADIILEEYQKRNRRFGN